VTTDLRRDVRVLQAYALVTTLALLVLGVSAFRSSRDATRFQEITVERINVVDTNGTIRLVLSNRARYPGVIIKGKEYPYARGQAGLLFFNEEGTEDGGISYGATHRDSAYEASGELMFDQYGQDQTVGLEYQDQNGRRTAGLHVWDRPDGMPIDRMLDSMAAIRRMPDGPTRTRAMQALQALTGATRLFAGKTPDRAATVVLADPRGRSRLRLVVDSAGSPRIDFLDSAGRVTTSLPGVATDAQR